MDTLVYHREDLYSDGGKLEKAAEILKNGGLVVIPTETVYGIAARGDDAGLQALNDIKGQKPSEFHSLHISHADHLERYVPSPDMRTAKLVHNFWPGPVTLVFNLDENQVKKSIKKLGQRWQGVYNGNAIGVRCPDNGIASRILELAGVPVIATSASLPGKAAATDFQQAFEMFNTKVPLMINDGQCQEAGDSTIVRISKGNVDILREGAVSGDDINDISTVNILFVCSTNTCCSPIAAGICRRLLCRRLGCEADMLKMFGYNVSSAGVMSPIKKPLRPEAVRLADRLGLNLSDHISTPLLPRDILCSDLILTMQEDQKRRITDFYPQIEDRCKLLAGDYDICDPSEGGEEVYAKFADVVESAINERIGELLI
jgi:tRNA threonylcarbamoyl adenosine modification protein (Sua5/YciO/YrdC/YwlC family)